MLRRSLTLLGLAVAAAWPIAASGQGPGVRPVASDPAEFVPGQYFVGFRPEAAAASAGTLRSLGARVTARFPRIRAAAVRVDEGTARRIALTPGVAYVEQVPRRYTLGLGDAQLVPALNNGLYGLVTTRATDTHANGITGAGIKVGVADEGLDYTHPDIAPSYRGGIDIVGGDDDPIYEYYFDEDWDSWVVESHGTHVAGTVAGANNSVGVVGAAPSVDLYHARVLGYWGGTVETVMAGVQWLVETADCKIINLSLGGAAPSATEEAFYQDMRSRGVLVVCAAGNSGPGSLIYPAAYPTNISVAAVDVNGALAGFSSNGPGLDVSAPGVGVLSSVPVGWGPLEGEVQTGAGTFSAIPFWSADVTPGTTGMLVDCGLGAPGDFPAEVAGNVALIRRGELTFVDKVTNAMSAGAAAVVMYNNVPGDFAGSLDGGALYYWIPTVGVSDTTGTALLGQTGNQVTVVNWGTHWDTYNGTSMATPHVTAALALVWSVIPSAPNTTVESLLFTTCRDLGPVGYDTTFGFGHIDALGAVARAQSPGSPPTAPTGLGAAAGTERITLTWNAVAGADYYLVQRAAQTGGPYEVRAQASGTSYTDLGLTSPVPFFYVVTAVNSWGSSGSSNEASATPLVVPPPAPPTNLTAKGAKRSVNLKWVQSAGPGVTQNRIYRSSASSGQYTLRATINPGTSFSDTGLASRVTYYYRVTALNGAGKESAPSNLASAQAR